MACHAAVHRGPDAGLPSPKTVPTARRFDGVTEENRLMYSEPLSESKPKISNGNCAKTSSSTGNRNASLMPCTQAEARIAEGPAHLSRKIPGMKDGDFLGHDFMGEETGKAVTHVRRGERVTTPFLIACGDFYATKACLQRAKQRIQGAAPFSTGRLRRPARAC